jgi:hypothetical protein
MRIPPRRRSLPALALLLAALSFSCGPRDVQSEQGLVGLWEGYVAWHDATLRIDLEVAAADDSLVAWLSAPAVAVQRQPLGRLEFASPQVRFALRDSGDVFAFKGWLRRGLVVGAFSSPALGGETNPSRLPQLSLRRHEAPAHPTPWPGAAAGAMPREAPAAERSIGAWLRARVRTAP